MAASIQLNNDYMRTFLYECHQMTDKMSTGGFSVSKNRLNRCKFYSSYQIVLPKEI